MVAGTIVEVHREFQEWVVTVQVPGEGLYTARVRLGDLAGLSLAQRRAAIVAAVTAVRAQGLSDQATSQGLAGLAVDV